MIHDGLWDPYDNMHMGNCGDLVAEKYGFTREQQDAFARQSFERAIQALLDGRALPGPSNDAPGSTPSDAVRVIDAIARVHRHAILGSDVVLDRPDRTRWGHLEIRDEIGRGASATVYRAWDTRLAREVALKLFAPDVDHGDAALDEGRLLARLNHPHIVTVFGTDSRDGCDGCRSHRRRIDGQVRARIRRRRRAGWQPDD